MHQIQAFYDPATYTVTYLVFDAASKDAIVIDPVLDYDPAGSQTSTRSVEHITTFLTAQNLNLHYILETHAHADHLSASAWLKAKYPTAKVAIGECIKEVQSTFKTVFNLAESFPVDGSQFDALLTDNQVLSAGTLKVTAIATPGHTPACMTFQVEDALFTGDALFMDDYGTGRCDFPRGSADELYTSIHERLYAFPDSTRVFVGHDYQPNGREVRWETTIGASKEKNVQLRQSSTREDFVTRRQARDATLAPPKLLFPSVQVNIDAGRLPEENALGMRYLHIPINMKVKTERNGVPKS